MEDGPIGASGQSVEVDVDWVNRRETDLVPTQDRWTVGEVVMDLLRRGEYATLGDPVLNPLVSIKVVSSVLTFIHNICFIRFTNE